MCLNPEDRGTALDPKRRTWTRGKFIRYSRPCRARPNLARAGAPGYLDSAGFGGSHISIKGVHALLDSLRGFSAPSAKVLLLDNLYVDGSSTPVCRQFREGDTYQSRTVADGAKFELLKNFSDETGPHSHLENHAVNVKFTALRYYRYLESYASV